MKSFLLLLLATVSVCAQLPDTCRQVIIGVAPGWNSSHVTLSFYEKSGNSWQLKAQPWKGRLGKKGLAWGLGAHTTPAGAKLRKREGDRRAPAGIFAIGGAFGYAAQIQKSPRLFYKQITTNDLWVEDVNSPSYNRHILLDHQPKTKWEKKQQMRQGDHAHSLKLFIAHNAPPQVVPGAGSAIFFHIWRGGGSKATFGCTTMSESALKRMISQIEPSKAPHYVLLPKAEYDAYRTAWKLP